MVFGGDPRAFSLFLSLLLEHCPAHRDIHEAPRHPAVLKYPPAYSASRLRRLESSRIALLLWGLGLRRRPLALGLVNAQRYETNDAR
jgi:hypothetical protein